MGFDPSFNLSYRDRHPILPLPVNGGRYSDFSRKLSGSHPLYPLRRAPDVGGFCDWCLSTILVDFYGHSPTEYKPRSTGRFRVYCISIPPQLCLEAVHNVDSHTSESPRRWPPTNGYVIVFSNQLLPAISGRDIKKSHPYPPPHFKTYSPHRRSFGNSTPSDTSTTGTHSLSRSTKAAGGSCPFESTMTTRCNGVEASFSR